MMESLLHDATIAIASGAAPQLYFAWYIRFQVISWATQCLDFSGSKLCLHSRPCIADLVHNL